MCADKRWFDSLPGKMIDESLPEVQEWMAAGRALAQAASGHQWAIADWMLLGEEQIGMRAAYDFAEKATGYKRKTLQEWAYVARHLSMRMEDLTFNHHQAVAALVPSAQKHCLEYAAAKTPKMPVTELREMARWQPHRLEIDSEGERADTSLLLRFQQYELDSLELAARQRGHISNNEASAVAFLFQEMKKFYFAAHPELVESVQTAYAAHAGCETPIVDSWKRAAHRAKTPYRAYEAPEVIAARGMGMLASDESVPPATSVEFGQFMERAAKIVRVVLPEAGVKDFETGPMVRNWLLKQTGKRRVDKISAAKFEELLSRLENAPNPNCVVAILRA